MYKDYHRCPHCGRRFDEYTYPNHQKETEKELEELKELWEKFRAENIEAIGQPIKTKRDE